MKPSFDKGFRIYILDIINFDKHGSPTFFGGKGQMRTQKAFNRSEDFAKYGFGIFRLN